MKENDVWRYIKPKLKPYTHFLERIDSKAIPDIHLITKNKEIVSWVELKIIEKFPLRGKTDLKLDMDQGTWLFKYARSKGNCWVLCFVEDENKFLMIPGLQAHYIAQKVYTEFLLKHGILIQKEDIVEIIGIIENGLNKNTIC